MRARWPSKVLRHREANAEGVPRGIPGRSGSWLGASSPVSVAVASSTEASQLVPSPRMARNMAS